VKGEKNMPNKYDAMRAFACIIDYMYFFDENTTVNGTVGVMDAGNYTMKVYGYLSMEERRDFLQTWQVRTTNNDCAIYHAQFIFWSFCTVTTKTTVITNANKQEK